MSKQAAPLYDLEHLSTVIEERTTYRVLLAGQVLGGIEVVAVGDDLYWLAEGSLIRFATQPEAIAWLVKLRRAG